jgi:hypothetical protein
MSMPDNIEGDFQFPSKSSNEHKQAQLRRIEAAMKILAEYFSGVAILAHEQEPDGNVTRYVRVSGNELAVRYQAAMWVKHEETIETQRVLMYYISKLKSSKEPPPEEGYEDYPNK